MLLFLLLLAAGGALVLFRTDVVGFFKASSPTYDKALLPAVTVSGAYSVEDLRLSPAEIQKLNVSSLIHRDIFTGIGLTLNPASKRAAGPVGSTTPLDLGLVFKTEENSEVCCWPRTVKRRDLVPHVVRSLERAKELYTHYRKEIGDRRSIKRLYL
ncbi:hypothetical protein [Pseudodesulfovibrio sp.]|uniref:hypothetical protein n=1 Tax=Pseudodesulfovibrio sp. TaxID=2035812 RepID=UPI00260A527B|nr:hypothetical protein [Pseudodesulfovibrio sp.]MDD3313046.1 hypothetical protein [Pseudodesulfovibrio sp.]